MEEDTNDELNQNIPDIEEEDDDLTDQESIGIFVSYVCEDCDYRWDIKFQDELEAEMNEAQHCLMCGSLNSVQI